MGAVWCRRGNMSRGQLGHEQRRVCESRSTLADRTGTRDRTAHDTTGPDRTERGTRSVHGGGAPRRTGELDFAYGRFLYFERGDVMFRFITYLGHLDE